MSGKNEGLSAFYRSAQWVKLLQVIKLERQNDQGEIICAHCGQPITRAYDIIGHHVIELNETNVCDADISLNPDNIVFVHHRCHNRIHNKLRYGEDVRQVYLVYGSPMSGKTTFVKDSMNAGDLVVDIDSIWQCISGCDRYVKPGRLNSCAFIIRDTLVDIIKHRTGKWLNAYIIGGYPLISERERMCRELGAREIFINTSQAECLHRLNNLSDGRDVEQWTSFIDEWWRRYTPHGSVQ